MKKSAQLFKASWSLLKVENKILKAVLLNFFFSISVLAVALFGIYSVGTFNGFELSATNPESTINLGLPGVLIAIVTFVSLSLFTEFVGAYIIVSALGRFRGSPLTHTQVMAKLGKSKWAIMKFGLLSMTIGNIINAIGERLPFGGWILSLLAGVAWEVAAMFTVAVIVDKEETSPSQALKSSAAIVKKSFGDNVRVNAYLVPVVLLITVAMLFIATGTMTIAIAVGATESTILLSVAAPIIFISISMGIFMQAISSIFKAGLYEYAVNGTTYGEFEAELFKQAITPKKARKLFGF